MSAPEDTESPYYGEGDTTFITGSHGGKRSLLPGDIIDSKYLLRKLLGQGGMGVVFSCTHLALDKQYALKLLNSDQLSGEYWSRFQQEAKALAKLNHPGIVGIHNMGLDGGQYPYYVMDLLSGETLESLLAQAGSLPADRALEIFIQVADAIGAAHQNGIIHRDIKPSNLMLERDQTGRIVQTKVVDFGIARLSKHGLDTQSQTATGLVFGTPFYMSPEQCQGLRVDERSDIYSFGCTLFETLTGRPPFKGENAFSTFMLHQTQPAPTLASVRPGVPFAEGMESAIQKMLAKRLNDRYPSMDKVRLDLERLRAGKPILAQGLAVTAQHRSTTPQAPSSGLEVESRQMARDNSATYPFSMRQTIIFGGSLLAVCMLGWLIQTFYWQSQKTLTQAKTVADTVATRVNNDDNLIDSRLVEFGGNVLEMKPLLAAYRADPKTAKKKFKISDDPPVYQFPTKFIIGCIKFGDDAPVYANGLVKGVLGKPVTAYFSNYTSDWFDLLDKFGPEDLTALELVTDDPKIVVAKVSKWKNLKDLTFFNSIVKALPKHESEYDESKMTKDSLKYIDQMEGLDALGVCGPTIDGREVIKMRLLNKLHTIKLKRISNLPVVLQALSTKDNITEVWITGDDIVDEYLQPLTAMKNLQTLRIRRSRITPACLAYIKKMPDLKHLIVDSNFSPNAVAEFKKVVPGFELEPTVDLKYWQSMPEKD